MIITFSDGRKLEGRIYTQTASTMRIVVKENEELVDFTCIRGLWLSANCEPVEIGYAWRRIPTIRMISEAVCICSQELASRLVESNLIDSDDVGESYASGGRAG